MKLPLLKFLSIRFISKVIPLTAFLTLVLPMIAGHPDVKGDRYNWLIFFAAACFLLSQYLLEVKIRRSHQGEVNNFKKLAQIELEVLAENIGLTDNDRLNVYIHTKKAFVLVARFAINRKFMESRGRPYPDDEGVISEAFRTEYVFEQIPFSPDTERDKYIGHMTSNFNMKKEVVEDIKMKCMAYASIVVYSGRDKVAVFLIESLKPDFTHLKDITLPNGSNNMTNPSVFDSDKIQRMLYREANRLSEYYSRYHPRTDLVEGY